MDIGIIIITVIIGIVIGLISGGLITLIKISKAERKAKSDYKEGKFFKTKENPDQEVPLDPLEPIKKQITKKQKKDSLIKKLFKKNGKRKER